MRATPRPTEHILQAGRRDLAGLPRHGNELYPSPEELRRAAFIGRNMRALVTKHGTPWRGQMRDGERVGSRACRYKKDRHFPLERLREAGIEFFRPGIAPIREHLSLVRPRIAVRISGAMPAALSLAKFMESGSPDCALNEIRGSSRLLLCSIRTPKLPPTRALTGKLQGEMDLGIGECLYFRVEFGTLK
jgi:hypothetical protein